jgi:pimeloyl-ACP methyl ester carboxylesterase
MNNLDNKKHHDGLDSQQHSNKFRVIVRKIAIPLGRILSFIISLLLCLPVVFLPLSTSVPAWVWIVLAIFDLILIILQFRMKPARLRIPASLAGLILVGILAVIASQFFAATPPIPDVNGKPLPGSIASLEKVSLNGTDQWITIRGYDVNKPILLNLGMGGPGGGGFATRTLFEPLEKDFVVVSWDEPGTGKSYNALPISTLTTERFIEDGHALTGYLQERFQQEKIYVYGVSWTSILGVWLVQQHPEDYYAYIGNGQMVNTIEDDVMGYELALDYLAKQGNTKKAEILLRNGPPPYDGDNLLDKYVAYLDVLNGYMGELPYKVVVPIVPFLAPEYGLLDKLNHTRGLIESFRVVYPQIQDLDFVNQAARLDVPVYIFAGKNDVNAMSSLVEQYFKVLEAPHKDLTWLEGGHGLDGENIGQFVGVMTNKVLVETYPKH